MRVVIVLPAAGLLAGAFLGRELDRQSETFALAGVLIAASCCGYAFWRRQACAFAIAVVAAFATGGIGLAADAWETAWRPPVLAAFERSLPTDHGAVACIVTGKLRTDASLTQSGVALTVDLESIEIDGKHEAVVGGVLLTVAGELAAGGVEGWRAGRRIRAPARLRKPSVYLTPGVPDAERELARRGVRLVGSIKSGALIDVVSSGGWLSEQAAALRAHVRRTIRSAVGSWSTRSAAIVTAIVIGDRTALDEPLRRRLQDAGTYHVMAISGGNIAILAALVIGLFRIAGALGRLARFAAIAILVAYAMVVAANGGTSVVRATVMAALLFAGQGLDLRGVSLNVLLLTAAVLVAAAPLAVVDASFLLTCGATAGILIFVPGRLEQSRILATILLMLCASLAAEAVLLPIGASYFSRVTFAGPVLSLLAIPLMVVVQIAGMVLIPVALVSSVLAKAIGWIAHAAAEGLVRSADLMDVIPFATWRVAPPGGFVMTVYYIALVTHALAWLRKQSGACWPARRAVAIATSISIVSATWIAFEPWTVLAAREAGVLRVMFLDVGQGDATFIRFPRGSTLLVDAGGLVNQTGFDVGDRVVAPVLRAQGVRRLSLVALTHAHPDHAGGLPAIIREFRPQTLWEGIPVPPSRLLASVRDAAREANTAWAQLQAHNSIAIDDVEVAVLHPGLADWERQDVRNDDSLVLELRWRDVSIVLTGDISRDTETAITPLLRPAPLRVVKVAHHGSLTSSGAPFLRSISPTMAVVSAGRGNQFGHPAPPIVDRYRAMGVDLFRTDRDGTITVESRGGDLRVRTFTGRTASF